MSATVDTIARRVTISHEIGEKADWAAIKQTGEQLTDEARVLIMISLIGDFGGSLRAGHPNRNMLLRVAGQCQAWVEQIDEGAAR